MTEWNAEGYERISALQRQMAAEALALVQFSGSERVLDVGCGNGQVTARVAKLVPQGEVVGVDASARMITFAVGSAETNYLANLQFKVCDARDLPFRSEFDCAVSFNAMHWIPDQERALRSLYAALRPGAWAQLRLVPRSLRPSIEDVLEETRSSSRWTEYFSGFADPYLHLTEDSYTQLAVSCGFKLLEHSVIDRSWDFCSREAFEEFGTITFAAWTERLPESSRLVFVRDVLDRYRKTACHAPGEEHLFRFYQMNVRLEKPSSPSGA